MPGGQPVIDWTNPITAGLVGCWVTTGEGGAKPVLRDLVSQTSLPGVGTAPSIKAGPVGLEARDGADNQGFLGLATAAQKPTRGASLLWFGRFLAAGTGANRLFGCIYNNPQSFPFDGFNLQRPNGNNIQFAVNVNGSQVNVTAAQTFTTGVYAFLGSFFPDSDDLMYLYGNGNLLANASGGSTGSVQYTATTSFSVGYEVTFGGHANAGMCVGAAWNRRLSPGESVLISADPTNFLLFPGDIARNVLGGATLSAFLASLSDNAASQDLTSGVSFFFSSFTDVSVSSDVGISNLASSGNTSDTATSSDLDVGVMKASASLSDTAVISDNVNGFMLATALLSDAGLTTDLFQAIGAGSFFFTLSDSISSSDALGANATLVSAIIDAIASSDAELGITSTSLSDNVASSDARSAIAVIIASLNDAVATSDLISFSNNIRLLTPALIPVMLSNILRVGVVSNVLRVGVV